MRQIEVAAGRASLESGALPPTPRRLPNSPLRGIRPPLLFALAGLLAACASPPPAATQAPPKPGAVPPGFRDPHSHARPDEVRVTHLDLSLDVDFERRLLSGEATLTLERSAPAAPLVLDVKALDVRTVASGTAGSFRPAAWRVEKGDPLRGDALVVDLAPADSAVRIAYATTAEGSGLLWLLPPQTAGKAHPYLFSQSQAIHARTWFPCQDTPSVRTTYAASVRVPAPLVAVMGAEAVGDAAGSDDPGSGRRQFRFQMPQPVPSYLVALAVGDLSFRPLGPRTGVWSEPSVVDAAAREFRDAEEIVRSAEALYGPYRWGRFDILVLPPSFPAGGMENPRLTFVSPTILAGDRSLVATIVHELAHSWSGNLVTNATWNDVWLNEGFTSYIEQRLVEGLYGPERSAMETALETAGLREELKELPEKDQRLAADVSGRDPDEAFTGVPYQKGATFLRLLEKTFGREELDRFLRRYFDAHAFSSMTTPRFVDVLRRDLFARFPKAAARIDLPLWLEGPGLPADAPVPVSDAFERVDAAAARFLSGALEARSIDAGRWTPHEWLRLIRSLAPGEAAPAPRKLAELDEAFHLTASGNAEIASAWLTLAVRSGYRAADARLESFLLGVGRPKLIKPIYQALAATPDGKARGRALLDRARSSYHLIAVREVEGVLR